MPTIVVACDGGAHPIGETHSNALGEVDANSRLWLARHVRCGSGRLDHLAARHLAIVRSRWDALIVVSAEPMSMGWRKESLTSPLRTFGIRTGRGRICPGTDRFCIAANTLGRLHLKRASAGAWSPLPRSCRDQASGRRVEGWPNAA
jgi:hypothetical protein